MTGCEHASNPEPTTAGSGFDFLESIGRVYRRSGVVRSSKNPQLPGVFRLPMFCVSCRGIEPATSQRATARTDHSRLQTSTATPSRSPTVRACRPRLPGHGQVVCSPCRRPRTASADPGPVRANVHRSVRRRWSASRRVGVCGQAQDGAILIYPDKGAYERPFRGAFSLCHKIFPNNSGGSTATTAFWRRWNAVGVVPQVR